jgi:hypothetical protein
VHAVVLGGGQNGKAGPDADDVADAGRLGAGEHQCDAHVVGRRDDRNLTNAEPVDQLAGVLDRQLERVAAAAADR